MWLLQFVWLFPCQWHPDTCSFSSSQVSHACIYRGIWHTTLPFPNNRVSLPCVWLLQFSDCFPAHGTQIQADSQVSKCLTPVSTEVYGTQPSISSIIMFLDPFCMTITVFWLLSCPWHPDTGLFPNSQVPKPVSIEVYYSRPCFSLIILFLYITVWLLQFVWLSSCRSHSDTSTLPRTQVSHAWMRRFRSRHRQLLVPPQSVRVPASQQTQE